jgi:enamine deaminase RidA (YjgF/YER057c/UK114 family)
MATSPGYPTKKMTIHRLAVIVFAVLLLGCQALAPKEEQMQMHGNVQHLNPAGLHKNPAYTQAVVVSGNATTIYVGGQNAVDVSGNIVGNGDLRAQTEKALQNIETALAAGGAGLQHVAKWNVYILHGQSAQAGFEAFQKVWGQRPNPPVISGIFVPALEHPDFLVEIDAIAVVPQK